VTWVIFGIVANFSTGWCVDLRLVFAATQEFRSGGKAGKVELMWDRLKSRFKLLAVDWTRQTAHARILACNF